MITSSQERFKKGIYPMTEQELKQEILQLDRVIENLLVQLDLVKDTRK